MGAGMAERSYPTFEVRDGSWEEQPHIQGVVAAWAQEGLKKIHMFKSAMVAVRRCTSSKVRSSGCALLEQP